MSLRANLRLEHRLLAVDHDGRVDLMLEIEAPEPPTRAGRPRASVALVVDESGSMAGAKLETARRCLAWLAGRLDGADRVALVGFDDQARLLRPLSPVADGDVPRAVGRLRPGGCTNLSGGLLLGLQQLEAAAEGPRTLLLLTDGWANQGITDPAMLEGIARKAAERGRTLSTIGFGDGFSEDLLRAMADAGRGNAHYADTPEAAPAIFAAELDGLTHLVAQTISLEVRPHRAVTQIDALNDYPAHAVPDGIRVELGDAYGGDRRRVVLRLHAGNLPGLGVCAIAELVLRYAAVMGSPELHTIRIPVAINLVSASEAAADAPDLEVTCEVESLLADRTREEAIRRADAGDHLGAQELLGETSERLRRLASSGPQTSRLAGKADELAQEQVLFDHSSYGASSRKLTSYRSHQSKRDRRRGSR